MRVLRIIWHAIAGHPCGQVTWGDVFEGAACDGPKGCGYHWTIADYQV